MPYLSSPFLKTIFQVFVLRIEKMVFLHELEVLLRKVVLFKTKVRVGVASDSIHLFCL